MKNLRLVAICACIWFGTYLLLENIDEKDNVDISMWISYLCFVFYMGLLVVNEKDE